MDKKKLLKKGKYLLFLLGCFILFLVIKKAGWHNITDILFQLSPLFLIPAIFIWLINLNLGTFRFKSFLSISLNFLEIFEVYLYGFLLNYAAAIQGLGIGARVGMLKMKKVAISRSSASIGLEVIYDILLSFAISLIGFLFLGNVLIKTIFTSIKSNFFLVPLFIIIALLITIWILRKHTFFENFFQTIINSFTLKKFTKNLFITFGIYFFGSLFTFLLYKAIGVRINFLLILFAGRVSYLCGLLSGIPGGLGVRDAVTGYICSLTGIPLTITFSISIITRFLCFIIVIMLLFLINIYKKIKESK